MADADLVAEIERVLPYVPAGADLAAKMAPALRAKLVAAMPGLKERAKTLVELIESARYLYADRPLALDERAAALVTPEARGLLGNLARDLAMVDPWSAEAAEAAVRAYAERVGAKLGAVAQPLRAALTGRTTSPGIFEVLAVLGKAESLARIADQAIGPAMPERGAVR
jgi:glutamyl-tRNA synthetase